MGVLPQVKWVALGRWLHEDMVLFCLLQETHLTSAECAALKIGGYQHVGQARTPNEGGVSILVRDGVGVEVGILEEKVPERARVTLRFSADVSLTIISAYFPGRLMLPARRWTPWPERADVNSHRVLWDPLRLSGAKGECIVE
ncbi:hypothetical protein, unlikely [Trypanosoma congolense IL3000]|uniref:Uncharacterized protein n=1 Tax=Trypanosoma congolense (strain IL3000) TaxID=1068625 RepID=F9W691_TRYCI|nr:hypothetical protein, unlikely [Trypanosoma congolense IL3000]